MKSNIDTSTFTSTSESASRLSRFMVITGWVFLFGFAITAALERYWPQPVRSFQFAYLVGFLGYALIVHEVWKTNACHSMRWWLFGCIAIRIILFPAQPTDDAYRYVWEGRVQRAGFNPYIEAPESPRLVSLRDASWPHINHPDYPAIYGPLAQLEFRLVASVYANIYIVKALHVAWDIIVLFIIMQLLRVMGRNPAIMVLYGLNPLVLSAFAIRGHLDSMMLCGMMMAMWLAARHRWMWMGVMIGLAAGCKIVALILIPWLIIHHWRAAVAAILTVFCVYLPFADAGMTLFQSLTRFTGTTEFLSLLGTMNVIDYSQSSLRLMVGFVLCVTVWIIAWRSADGAKNAHRAMSALLVLAPIIHFWYVCWVLVFAPLERRMSWHWLAMSFAMVLYWNAEYERTHTGTWALDLWCAKTMWLIMIAGRIVHLLVSYRTTADANA